MNLAFVCSIVLFSLLLLLQVNSSLVNEASKSWLVRTNLALDDSIRLARQHHFNYVATVRASDGDYLLLESNRSVLHHVNKREADNGTARLGHLIKQDAQKFLAHPDVQLVKQEKLLTRSKRDFIEMPVSEPYLYTKTASRFARVQSDTAAAKTKLFGKYLMQDPLWPQLWYLNRHIYNRNLTDMNVTAAWTLGFTGKGVSVTFLDDGLEWDHPDIKPNFDPAASYDFNDMDNNPAPRYEETNENKHGTRCAGEVAAAGNNSVCSIGVAYNAGVGGLRMLDGPITDSLEARSLSYNRDHIDIYSASWGPTDNGEQLDGPDALAQQAFLDGVTYGRNGLGSIYVWASGNGGIYGDSCACDGYVNSIYTISISSTTDQETKPWYLEECTSVLATVYSSGDAARGQHSIATTDLHYKCTAGHTATSAAAPIAAGIIALTLEANPNLTWRDVMYLIVLTSRPKAIASNNYFENKRGFLVSNRYGFGLMDAGRMVELALTWKNVPELKTCRTDNSTLDSNIMNNFNRTVVFITTDACKDTENEVNYIEQVEILVSIRTPIRGKIELYLTSPMGTRSQILNKRPKDKSHRGFNKWVFMTVQLWGESPRGEWKLEIANFQGSMFVIDRFELAIHGVKEKPSIYV